jgi:site-specific DNA-cytosine methylase
MTMRRILDLYSGLGGASQAFLKAGWDVVRIDNNPLLEDIPNTEINDIMSLLPPYHFGEPFDLIWASPPCVEFSTAYSAPAVVAKREGKEFKPDLSLCLKAKEIIDHLNPQYWVIENVKGANNHFTKALQMPPRQIVNQFYFWGKFPFIHIDSNWRHSKYDGDKWSSDPLRANYRAKIPLEISKAFLNAIEGQTTLEGWL